MKSPSKSLGIGMAAGALGLLSLLGCAPQPLAAAEPAQAASTSTSDEVARGRYLTTAGDCVVCHTKSGGAPFAGGRAVETPFGAILSANITSDPDTGIGSWTPAQFRRAMHDGIDAKGDHLYPAFPYNYFTHMPQADTDAILAYLKTVPAVKSDPDRDQLSFPFNVRAVMIGWNTLFLNRDPFRADPKQSAEWNRGAYLVEDVGHCGACHTPMDFAGAPKDGQFLQGGRFAELFAPDLSANPHTGLGSWSADDIVEFLKTGRNAHAEASAEMAEVVEHSTSQLTDGDLQAIAVYLKSQPASPEVAVSAPSPHLMRQGAAIFADSCSACHQPDASGVPGLFPPLVHNADAQQRDPTSILHSLLTGTQGASTETRPSAFAMPGYAWKLSDQEIAAVATYLRNSWGNSAPEVSAGDVASLRKKLVPQ